MRVAKRGEEHEPKSDHDASIAEGKFQPGVREDQPATEKQIQR
jgi:hypothetical protein